MKKLDRSQGLIAISIEGCEILGKIRAFISTYGDIVRLQLVFGSEN